MNKFVKTLMLAGILLPSSIMFSACALNGSAETNNGSSQTPAGPVKQDPLLTMLTTSKVYDGTETLEEQVHYATNQGAGEVTVKWYNEDGTVECAEAKNVGNYMIEVTVAENEQFNAKTFDKTAFSVTAKEISPSVLFTKEYDNTIAFDNITLTTEHGLIEGDEIAVSASAQHKNVGAGINKETINYTGESVGNYIIDTTSIAAEITKLKIAPTITSEVTYGSGTSEGYVGEYKTLTTSDGIFEGDVVKVAACYDNGKDVGTYNATKTKVTGTNAGNYEVDTTNIKIKVNKKAVRITWADDTEAVYSRDDKQVYGYPTATVNANDLVSGDTCEVRYSGIPSGSSSVGFQTISYSYLSNNNYELATGQTTSVRYIVLSSSYTSLSHNIEYLKAYEVGYYKVRISTAGDYTINKNLSLNSWWVGDVKLYNESFNQVSVSGLKDIYLSKGTYYVYVKPHETFGGKTASISFSKQ